MGYQLDFANVKDDDCKKANQEGKPKHSKTDRQTDREREREKREERRDNIRSQLD